MIWIHRVRQGRLQYALIAWAALYATHERVAAQAGVAIDLDDGTVRTAVVHDWQIVTMPEIVGSSDLQPGRPSINDLGSFNLAIAPGATLAANLPALNAFNRAANQWKAFIADPIVVTINADMASLGSGILGQTSSSVLLGNYSTLRNAMVADAADEPDDGIVASLPVSGSFTLPAGIGVDGGVQVTKANAKALGFTGLDTMFGASDASITFNSNFAFDFDRSDGIGPGLFDFEGIAVHEIGHALGFISDVDYVDAVLNAQTTVANVEPTTLDLFRFSDGGPTDPATVADFQTFPRSMVPGAPAIFDQITGGFGGSVEVLLSTGITQGDGRQASHWKDGLGLGVMDPTVAPQELLTITQNDLRAFDLIGYEIIMVPEASSFTLLLIGNALAFALRKRHRIASSQHCLRRSHRLCTQMPE